MAKKASVIGSESTKPPTQMTAESAIASLLRNSIKVTPNDHTIHLRQARPPGLKLWSVIEHLVKNHGYKYVWGV